MKWEKVERSSYEGKNGIYDFSIRKEKTQWFLDVFLNDVNTSNDAYLETFTFQTLRESKKEAELYI